MDDIERCQIVGCNNQAYRSINARKLIELGFKLGEGRQRSRVKICKEHYKAFKKKTKTERRLEKWRFMRSLF